MPSAIPEPPSPQTAWAPGPIPCPSVLSELHHLEFHEEGGRRCLSPSADHTLSPCFRGVWPVSLLSHNPQEGNLIASSLPVPFLPEVLTQSWKLAWGNLTLLWPLFLQDPTSCTPHPRVRPSPCEGMLGGRGTILPMSQTQPDPES